MGRFIAIEGGDGSGKATQSELLFQYLNEQDYSVLKVSFPRYGQNSAHYVEKYLNGVYGEANDVHPDLGVLPFAIDRYAASQEIRDHLAKPNSIVIADRYMASNLAHQGTKISDPDSRQSFYSQTMVTEYEVLGIPRPDLNIVLIVPTKSMQENVDKKDARSYTDKKRDIHEADADHLEKAKRNYEELCQLYPDEFHAINCAESDSMRSIESIQADIRNLINL